MLKRELFDWLPPPSRHRSIRLTIDGARRYRIIPWRDVDSGLVLGLIITGMNPAGDPAEQHFVAAERQVEEHSAELKKELSLPDLVLTQVLYITGLGWLGTAAKLGSSHFLF